MKNKKVMKRVLVIAIVAAVAAGGIGGGIYVQRSKMTAEVQSVADLNNSYWGDEVNSSGLVTNDYSQTVEVSKDDGIKEVYVEEGQQVQKGDKLLALDTTVATLNLQGKELEVENLKNQITLAQNELKKVEKYKTVCGTVRTCDTEAFDTGCSGNERGCLQLYFVDSGALQSE